MTSWNRQPRLLHQSRENKIKQTYEQLWAFLPNTMRAQFHGPALVRPSLVTSSICESSVDNTFYAWHTVASGLEKVEHHRGHGWFLSEGRPRQACPLNSNVIKDNESTYSHSKALFVARCLVPIICWHIPFSNDFLRTPREEEISMAYHFISWSSATVLPLATCKQHLPAFNSSLAKDRLYNALEV